MLPAQHPEDDFRKELREFLDRRLPRDWCGPGALGDDERRRFLETFRTELCERGYLAVTWPRCYGGGGRTVAESIVAAEELTRVGLGTGAPNDAAGIHMLGNTLLVWGTEEQRQHFLPRILSGEYRFCQGFSEPDAGSDLASLRCSARSEGGQLLLNGQKLWSSAAQLANWVFVLCRTNQSVEARRGISLVMCDLRQGGVEIRPIRQLNGRAEFGEIFFTDASVSSDHVVGGLDNGWAVAMTLLGLERGETVVTQAIEFRQELDRIVELARARGRVGEALIRDRLARCYAEVEVMRFISYRVVTAIFDGRGPGPEASIAKLMWSEYHQRASDLALDILGAAAMIGEGRAPRTAFAVDELGAPVSSGSSVGVFLNARAGTIYSGTSEIQRNIIAERVLGLPKEPRPLAVRDRCPHDGVSPAANRGRQSEEEVARWG